jgi:phosphinothricin acetyltransferase
MATGNATFEVSVPDRETWDAHHLADCRLVARRHDDIVGWAALSPVSSRRVYAGVAEVSLYVAGHARGCGVGRALLGALVEASERAGIWTLQAGIFPENVASLALHAACGFRVAGRRERIGRMAGVWRDVLLLERRSRLVGGAPPEGGGGLGETDALPRVRATAVLIEDDAILLVEQSVSRTSPRRWSLPGGKLEPGETLDECLRREVREETGLEVAVGRMLYVGERLDDNRHTVLITFAVRRVGGTLTAGHEPEPGAFPIGRVVMVPLADLPAHGFGEPFCRLALAGFAGEAGYVGLVDAIGL